MAFTIFHSVEEWTAQFAGAGRCAVTVGNFDGLHLGHQKILRSVRERARATGERAAVITFDPHPMRRSASGTRPADDSDACAAPGGI